MSKELELYLERKAICMESGVTEREAVQIAWDQVRELLVGKPMIWEIQKDLNTHKIQSGR